MPGVTGVATVAEVPPQPVCGAVQASACNTNQVQVATQTQSPATSATSTAAGPDRKQVYTAPATSKGKKARYPLLSQQQTTVTAQQQTPNFPAQNYQLDPAAGKSIISLANFLYSKVPKNNVETPNMRR